MSFFKAAILENTGKPLAIRTLKIPNLEVGQVLVKISHSGVCHSQLMEIQGLRGEDKYLPHLLGHEGVGVVLEIGSGVTKVKVGDEVIIGWIKGSGISSRNPIFYDEIGTRINAGLATTFSEITIVSENRVYLKPAFLSDRIAVLFGCALLTGAGMVFNELTPRLDQSVLVLGLGGVGMSALLATLTINPDMIIAADISKVKRKLAKDLGIKNVLDPAASSFIQEVKEITKGGVNLSYECAGSKETIEKAFACLKEVDGHLIFASHPKYGDKIEIDPYELIAGKSIKGSWGGSSKPDIDIPKFAKLLKDSRLELINSNIGYTLDTINQAVSDFRSGVIGRPTISME
jgi:S-(hydroxymethyl)glutathione dehydrogenase/alcohol dehydrogenase